MRNLVGNAENRTEIGKTKETFIKSDFLFL